MNRLTLRALIIVAIAGLLGAIYYYVRSRSSTLSLVDIPPVRSAGYIIAIRQTDNGNGRLVAIAPEGTFREPESTSENDDQTPIWKTDGRRVFFISNRTSDGSYQLFEWLPDRDNEPKQLTPNGASRAHPWAHPKGGFVVLTSRGSVFKFTYPALKMLSLFPPGAIVEDTPGVERGMEQAEERRRSHQDDLIIKAWNDLSQLLEGEAFMKGYVDVTEKYFVGIYMTSRAQSLVVQNLEPTNEQEIPAHVPLAGETVEVCLDSKSSRAIVNVVDFQYPILSQIPPEKIKPGGKIEREFASAVLVFSLDGKEASYPIFLDKEESVAMAGISLSPSGDELAMVVLQKQKEAWIPQGLLIAPVKPGGISEARRIAEGPIEDPSWSHDGEKLTYIKNGDIYTINRDGSKETNLTKGKGKFSHPSFSPQ